MSWASRRQAQYIFGLLAFLGFIAFLFFLPSLTKAPTCSDGKQNGGERGVDCGGICQRICNADVAEPVILWYRAFPVTGNFYNLVAYIENSNSGAAVENVSYQFKIYDQNNILIGRRQGSTYIPPNQEFAIFEPRFDADAGQIKSVTFEFTSPLVWVKKAPTIQTLPIKVEDTTLGGDINSPSLTATISNESIYNLPAFDVIAILYDADHNAINASKTHKDGLLSNDRSLVLFTWPQAFSGTPVTKDIMVEINPFLTSF